MSEDIPLLSHAECAQRLKEKRPPSLNYYAFYSSFLGGVVTDPALMTVPIDDHMVHRGHAVFDTATLVGGKVYRLEIHLDRLEASARKARIPLPMSRDKLRAVILRTCALSGRRDASIRYWLSVGAGDFGIVPCPGAPSSFYVLIFGGIPTDPALLANGIREATVTSVPLKPDLLATLKSNNYLLNALTAMDARDRNGRFGILVNPEGQVAESCVLNVALVDAAGVFRTPPFDGILSGTTVRRAMDLAPALPAVRGVEQVPLRVDDLYAAQELMLLAGDSHIYPIVELDGRVIGSGRPGPVAQAIQAAIDSEMAAGEGPEFTEVPYN